MKKRLGLRVEVGLHLGILLAAALLFSGLVQLKIAEQEMVKLRLDHAKASLELLAAQMNPQEILGEAEGLTPSFSQQLSRLELGGTVLDAVLINHQGSVQDSYNSGESLPHRGDFRRAQLTFQSQVSYESESFLLPLWPGARGTLRITVPVEASSSDIGAFQVEIQVEDPWPQPWYAANMMLFYALIFGLILLFFGMQILNKSVIGPVRMLHLATKRFRGHNFSESIPPSGPKELADLTDSFNEMAQDLTAEKMKTQQTIEQLQASKASLLQTQDELIRSEKMASVGHLAAGMAHEIGNPLGATIGYLNLLKSEIDSADKREIVDRSLEELNRIDRLIRDVLDYSRPCKTDEEELDPVTVFGEAVTLLEQQGAFKGLFIQNNLPETLPRIRACHHKLVQVAVNLMLNARDAIEAGGLIRLEGRAFEDSIVMSVIDNGIGLSPEVIQHLFDPFFTTKDPGEGCGLGLAICQRVMEEFGGKIDVQSEPGQGTCFELVFPRIKDSD